MNIVRAHFLPMLLMVASVAAAAPPRILSVMSFGSPTDDLALGVSAAPDAHGLRVSGSVTSWTEYADGTLFGEGIADAFLATLDQRRGNDPSGTMFFRGPGEQRAMRMRLSPFGDYFLIGSPLGPTTLESVPPVSFNTTLTLPDYPTPNIPTADVFVACVGPRGELRWFDLVEGPYSNFANDVTPDVSGGAYVVGTVRKEITFNFGRSSATRLPASGYAPDAFSGFVARYDAAGTILWARGNGGGENPPGLRDEDDGTTGAVALPDGGVVVTGLAKGLFTASTGQGDETRLENRGGADGWIARWTPDGDLVWLRQVGGPGNDIAYAIDRTRSGRLVVCGTFEAGAWLDGTAGPIFPTSRGGIDAFVAELDPDTGAVLRLRTLGSAGEDVAWGVSAAPDQDRWYIGGTFSGALRDQDGATVAFGSAGTDAMVVSFGADGSRGRFFSLSGPGYEVIYNIVALPWGRVGVAGTFTDTANLAVGNLPPRVSSQGASDGIFALIDSGEGPTPSEWLVR